MVRSLAGPAVAAAALAGLAACGFGTPDPPPVEAPRGDPTAAVEGPASDAGQRPINAAAAAVGARVAELERIAGLRGVWMTADVTFVDAPDLPHRIVGTWVFPDRARFELSNLASPMAGRRSEYRLGDRIYVEAPELEGPAALIDEQGASLHRLLELRRALMVWPNGFAWAAGSAPTERRAELQPFLDGGAAGALVATLDDEGRPRSMACLGPEGRVEFELAVRAWGETEGRAHPTEIGFASGGAPVWTERVQRFEPDAFFVDSYFLPPSLRGDSGPSSRGQEATVGPLSATVTLTRALAPDERNWTSAPAAWDRLRAEESAHEVSPIQRIELDAEGNPAAVVLTLVDAASPPPTGWVRRGATVAARLVVGPQERIGGPRLEALRRELPLGPEAPRPYLRIDPSEALRILVQPLE